MGHIDAPAWWADVQHLRDVHERTDEARRLAELAERRPARDRQTSDVAARRHEVRDRQGDVEIVRPLPPRRGPHVKGSAIPTRRTIEIRGRTVPAPTVPRESTELDRRRPPRRALEVGPRPDRLAMWALLMGIVLILVAVGTADASVLTHR